MSRITSEHLYLLTEPQYQRKQILAVYLPVKRSNLEPVVRRTVEVVDRNVRRKLQVHDCQSSSLISDTDAMHAPIRHNGENFWKKRSLPLFVAFIFLSAFGLYTVLRVYQNVVTSVILPSYIKQERYKRDMSSEIINMTSSILQDPMCKGCYKCLSDFTGTYIYTFMHVH